MIFWCESDRMELGKQAFGFRESKTNLSQMSDSADFRIKFPCLLAALGSIFMTFRALDMSSKSADV